MLKSRYDAVFWGKTPWGLLHALLWRKAGRDVLVIDDQTLSTANGGNRWLSRLEVQALKLIGERFQIPQLGELDAYLREARLKIQTPHFQWVTGPTARDNLREFVRKFPIFQTPSLIEAIAHADIEGDLQKIQKSWLDWFRSPQVRNRQTPPFNVGSIPWFTEFERLMSEELVRPYKTPSDGELNQLVAAFCATTEQVVKYNFTSHEAAYLALRMLSPMMELDERWFERELIRGLQQQGAHIKRTGVQSWQFWEGKVEAALLDSYEGVVSHQRLLLYGIPQSSGSLEIRFEEKVYRGLETNWPRPAQTVLEEPRAEITCLTDARLMSTDIPMMLLNENAQSVQLQVLVEERPGAKPEFYRNEASEMAVPFLKMAFAHPLEFKEAKVGQSWDVWIEESASSAVTKKQIDLSERRKVHVLERVGQTELNGVQYWGPLMTRRFGVVGFLTEVLWDLA